MSLFLELDSYVVFGVFSEDVVDECFLEYLVEECAPDAVDFLVNDLFGVFLRDVIRHLGWEDIVDFKMSLFSRSFSWVATTEAGSSLMKSNLVDFDIFISNSRFSGICICKLMRVVIGRVLSFSLSSS